MQTQRLRALIGPLQTELLLDSYASASAVVPATACKQRDLRQLPQVLRQVAERAKDAGQVWTAWADRDNAWLLIGHITLERARERGRPVLEIQCYDTARQSKVTIMSTRLADGSWQACAE